MAAGSEYIPQIYHKPWRIQISPVMILYTKNIGIAVEISLLSYIQAEITLFYNHFQLQTTIFDFSPWQTAEYR